MANSIAQKRAKAKYRKEKMHSFSLFFYPSHMDLYQYLHKQSNMNAFMLGLIKADMDAHGL